MKIRPKLISEWHTLLMVTTLGILGLLSYEIIPTPPSVEKYTVAHSTTLYALDSAGRTRILFPYEAGVDEIVKGLKAILASNI